ncbi:MAG: LLM class flavin-dependent oxidoreductase [Alicyclobacillaceae bacterium]|nr:LLM class flavin-dependent oxidoreductase [Alicyclobacillaceae bacterium]
MKFIFANIFPYRDLPEDFAQKYESSWVDIPSHLYDRKKGHQAYNDYLDQYELAIRLGFDAVGFNEHHGNAYGMDNSPNLMSAAIARKVRETEKTCIALLGPSIALYNPPLRVAEEIAMLDTLTGGRMIAGFPAGTSMDTNYVYGLPPAELRPRFWEALDLIRQAWTRKETFSFNGRFTQLRYVNIWPRPYQDPHPPIWLPGSGSLETWDYCIRNNFTYAYLSYAGYKNAQKFMDGYWEYRDKLGKDQNPYWVGYNQFILVSETDERAERDFEQHVRYFYNKLFRIPAKYAEAPGYRTPKSLLKGGVNQFALHGQHRYSGAQREIRFKEMVESGALIAGSPATVRDMLKEVIQRLRVGTIVSHFQIGSAPQEIVLKSIELFAREVMPHLQGIWDDEWPVVGWPKVAYNRLNQQQEVQPVR